MVLAPSQDGRGLGPAATHPSAPGVLTTEAKLQLFMTRPILNLRRRVLPNFEFRISSFALLLRP